MLIGSAASMAEVDVAHPATFGDGLRPAQRTKTGSCFVDLDSS